MTVATPDARQFFADHLGAVEFRLKPIEKGGSDRHFSRILLMDGRSFIFMHYGAEVAENAYWTEINRFLTDIGLPVPRIIAHDASQRFTLIEDLGDQDLFSLAGVPWSRRRQHYLAALSEIHRLHMHAPDDLPSSLALCPGYDAELYRWEQDYFLQECARGVCRLDLSDAFVADWETERQRLTDRLMEGAPCLIHRDFQSQNILIKNDRPVFIDFQGMRKGNLFYDLASLLCDPYVTFTDEERHELMAFYYRILSPSYSFRDFASKFWDAAAQRLMQALGAYGFLGLRKNKRDFLTHIDNGLANLAAAAQAANLPALSTMVGKCVIGRSKA